MLTLIKDIDDGILGLLDVPRDCGYTVSALWDQFNLRFLPVEPKEFKGCYLDFDTFADYKTAKHKFEMEAKEKAAEETMAKRHYAMAELKRYGYEGETKEELFLSWLEREYRIKSIPYEGVTLV